jgi:hypothetical protein
LGVFTGFHLSVTGLNENGERDKIQHLVQSHGGIYSGTLDLARTTHLVARECSGAKYEAASQYGLKLVPPEWVYECVRRGVWVAEVDQFALPRARSQRDHREMMQRRYRGRTEGEPKPEVRMEADLYCLLGLFVQ